MTADREPDAVNGIRQAVGTVAIVGSFDNTHVGGSLARAASRLGWNTRRFEASEAMRGNTFLRRLVWRAARRPLRLDAFSAAVTEACSNAERSDVLIATGGAPLKSSALRALRARGVFCINYSTDDPWNPSHRSRWHLSALRDYDVVFTPRRANMRDFADLGCADVRYLPFGYDEDLFAPVSALPAEDERDVLFVGGADADRLAFMEAFMREFPRIALVGGRWSRYAATRGAALGEHTPDSLRRLTAAAKVNLCLVRRANRDGHVMRTFEAAATGACMLVEDTAEHRSIFGENREAVVYFTGPGEAAVRARELVADAAERARLAAAVRARIVAGAHTYRDRLAAMLEAAHGTS